MALGTEDLRAWPAAWVRRPCRKIGETGSPSCWHALIVEPHDIQRVAQAYLIPSNLTVGWSLPGPGGKLAVADRDSAAIAGSASVGSLAPSPSSSFP